MYIIIFNVCRVYILVVNMVLLHYIFGVLVF